MLMLTLNTTCVLSQDSEFKQYTGIISGNSVNLRSGPGLNFEILRKVNNGDLVLVLDKEAGWVKVKLPRNTNAYVHKGFMTAYNDISGKITAENVNVRAGRGTDFNVIGQLNQGDLFEIIERDGDWIKIYPYTNCFAWVSEDFVKMHGPEQIYEKIENIKKESVSLLIAAEEFEKSYLSKAGQEKDMAPILQKYKAIIRDYPDSETAHIAKKNISQLSGLNTVETKNIQAAKEPILKKPTTKTKAKTKKIKKILKTKNEKKKKHTPKKTTAVKTKKNNAVLNLSVPKGKPLARGKLLEAGRFFNRSGTHKLFDKENGVIYSLKSSLINLNKFVYYQVNVWGKLDKNSDGKYPLIDVIYVEKLN